MILAISQPTDGAEIGKHSDKLAWRRGVLVFPAAEVAEVIGAAAELFGESHQALVFWIAAVRAGTISKRSPTMP